MQLKTLKDVDPEERMATLNIVLPEPAPAAANYVCKCPAAYLRCRLCVHSFFQTCIVHTRINVLYAQADLNPFTRAGAVRGERRLRLHSRTDPHGQW